ncbi:helix-turn-helix domain-containing protein [Streptomyces syringium]|uniref:helix-turn-helix domain-containing protein n=1 Tax=Streptomyces syringium TaxID=76729 RepID=UPI0033EE8E43
MPEAKRVPWSLPLSEVGQRLKELRERRDLTQSSVAEALRRQGFKLDASAMSNIEGGKRRRLSRDLTEALLDCYDANTTERAEILGFLSVDTTPAGRPRPALWRRHASLLGPMHFEGFLKLELQAAALHNWEPFFIPGLLQTRDYATHVIQTLRPDLTPAELRGLVDVRLDRQHKIEQGPMQDFRALINEDALRTTIRNSDVMHGQLQRLLTETDHPRKNLRILPNSTGCHPGMAGPFVLMKFPQAPHDIVWAETMASSVYFDNGKDTRLYAEAFAGLWERALDLASTKALLKKRIKESSQ